MFGINNILLNIFIILVCLLLYFTLSEKLDKRLIKPAIGILTGSTCVLCMTFPITSFPGHSYDLRFIPLLISILYGGLGPGLFVTLVVVIYRYYLGGNGFYHMLYSYSAILTIAFLLTNRFASFNRFKRILAAVLLDFVMVVILSISFSFEYRFNSEYAAFFIRYFVIHVIATWMCIDLIETLRENAKMRLEMVRAEKMAVLGELAASIAHEIRNPLTVSQGFLQLLKEQIDDEKHIRYLNLIISETARAESIISDYLSFAKPQIEKIERYEIGKIVDQVIAIMMSYAAQRNVRIDRRIAESLFAVVDPEKLTQVLMNIMKNGIESMQNGGILDVVVYHHKDKAVIEIIDKGVGMSKEELDRVGNPFYSTKEKGTGLGLMICFRYIEAMHGKIEVTSEKGKGTCFSIMLACKQ